jgi:hypothetical protein
MSCLKILWRKLTNKTSISPALAVVEEDDSELLGEILSEVLIGMGALPTEIRNLKFKEMFEAWYTGPCTKEGVAASITDFKEVHGISLGCEKR